MIGEPFVDSFNGEVRADGISYVRKYSGSPVTTLFKFKEAVSPHVAAREAHHIVSHL